MRKVCLTLLFLFQLLLYCQAQYRAKIDSLKRWLQTAKEDTTKVKLLSDLGTYYIYIAKDTALAYIQQQLLVSKQSNYLRGMVIANDGLCYWHYLQSNYPRALEYAYKALQLAEQGADSASLANCYNMLGHVNGGQKNYTQALAYYKQYFALLPTTAPQESKALALSNIGVAFLKLNQPDSVLHYAEEGYQLFRTAKNQQLMSGSLQYLAEAQFQLGNRALGEAYLNMAKENSVQTGNLRALGKIYNVAARQFSHQHQNDSALFYARMALPLFERVDDKASLLDSYTLLTDVFQANHQLDSAFFYQSKLVALNNDIAAQNSIADVQNINFEERMREQEKEIDRRKEADERRHNLQYAALALGLVALLIGFLVLSHSVLANQKLIRFLGVVSLLIVFEFLNLLLHPWLGKITHESPVLMLLIMVALAAILVPLHHRLEHWITHKLVEKNNRIRLAAAKRTIQQLEGETDDVAVSKKTGMEQMH